MDGGYLWGLPKNQYNYVMGATYGGYLKFITIMWWGLPNNSLLLRDGGYLITYYNYMMGATYGGYLLTHYYYVMGATYGGYLITQYYYVMGANW